MNVNCSHCIVEETKLQIDITISLNYMADIFAYVVV